MAAPSGDVLNEARVGGRSSISAVAMVLLRCPGKTSLQQRLPARPAMSPEPSRSLRGDLGRVEANFSERRGVSPGCGIAALRLVSGCKAARDKWAASTPHVSAVFRLGWVCGAQLEPSARGYAAFAAWELYRLKRGDSGMRYLVHLP